GQHARRDFCPGWSHKPGQKAPILSRLVSPTGTKGPRPPAGPASRWTRDKSHLLSRAQRLPGQMARNKSLFCSSATIRPNFGRLRTSSQAATTHSDRSSPPSRLVPADLIPITPCHIPAASTSIPRRGGRPSQLLILPLPCPCRQSLPIP